MKHVTTSNGRPAPSSGLTAETLAEALRRDIADGRLGPGEALRQEELALRFGTSRIPVREALRALQAEGLVSYSPNRGATVAVVSDAEIQEMLEVRIALECHALRLAVPNAADSDIAEARRILREYDAAPDAGAWSAMNWSFHWTLYLPCDCRRLLDAIERNHKHFNSAARTKISALAGKERPQREHHRLLGLVEKGRVEDAVSLLEGHIRDTQRSIRAKARGR
jgi:DNA-binding GntR family transcriptional regulator